MLVASVIILGHNGRDYIDGCLRSVLDQSFPAENYEVIWADNCSTDGSAELVSRQFGAVRVVRFDQNYGFAEGNNRATEHAQGRYIVFLNQDTIVDRNWLSSLILAVESDPTIKACHSNMVMPWHSDRMAETEEEASQRVHIADLTRFGYVGYTRVPFSDEYIQTLFVSGASVLIDRDMLEELEYVFDPDLFAYCEDVDLCLRINSLGYKTVLVPTSILYHDQQAQDSSIGGNLRKASLITKNRFLVFFKNMYLPEYLLFLPLLMVGAPFKVTELGWKGPKQFVHVLGSMPMTLWCFFRAVLDFPKYLDRRRKILATRKEGKFWLLRRLMRGGV